MTVKNNYADPPARNRVIRTLAGIAPAHADALTDALPLTSCEAASIVGISPTTLSQWRSRQERGQPVPITIPFYRRGRNVQYRLADLVAALTGNPEQEHAPC